MLGVKVIIFIVYSEFFRNILKVHIGIAVLGDDFFNLLVCFLVQLLIMRSPDKQNILQPFFLTVGDGFFKIALSKVGKLVLVFRRAHFRVGLGAYAHALAEGYIAFIVPVDIALPFYQVFRIFPIGVVL